MNFRQDRSLPKRELDIYSVKCLLFSVPIEVVNNDLIAVGVAKQLREAILNGELSPGEYLVESVLAERLGVSRGPVREAIRMLADQGLVDKRPRRRATVSDFSVVDVEEIYSLRELLEGFAIELILKRPQVDPSVVRDLDRLTDQMREAADQRNLPQFMDCDVQFHTTLVMHSGHQRLRSLWAVISPQVRRFMVFNERLFGDLKTSAEIHVPILVALREKNLQAGLEAVRTHIRESGARVLKQVMTLRNGTSAADSARDAARGRDRS